MTESLPLTLGTGGHIDHGKTALIRALTGVDTDRLPQERARGISIELGYASLQLPSGRRLSVIDVPGHERFVRTMVAGATGIDLYLMAVAADDGVMPQTREHAAVLAALAVRRGVVAVTKTDLADPQPAMLQAAELLPEAEVVAVCARTGEGLEALAAALERVALKVRSRAQAPGSTRLHIDRVFTIRGSGTVVTGTLWSGSVAGGAELVLFPAGRRVRVRGVQVHDCAVEEAASVTVSREPRAITVASSSNRIVRVRRPLRPVVLIPPSLTTTVFLPRVAVSTATRCDQPPATRARTRTIPDPKVSSRVFVGGVIRRSFPSPPMLPVPGIVHDALRVAGYRARVAGVISSELAKQRRRAG